MKSAATLSKIILVLIFFLSIFTPPVIFLFQNDSDVSAAENRRLAKKPKFSVEMEKLLVFPEHYENYYNDHFGLRNFFLDLYSRGIKSFVAITGLHVTDNLQGGKVIQGKDGWLFLHRIKGAPLSDYRNIEMYSRKELWEATLAIAARKHWLAGQGIRYLFLVTPNKHTIYPEFLPDYIGRKGEISSMDQIYGHLSSYTSVPFVDLRQPLWQHKSSAGAYWQGNGEDARLYWKTDSHWNSAGADIAQYEIARQLEKMFPGSIAPMQRAKEDFQMTAGSGDLAQLLNDESLMGERVPTIHTGLCAEATHSEYRERSQATTCDKATVNALIFHDSFLLALKPFLADYFARALFVWENMSQEGVQLRQAEVDPAVVIEEISERFLPYVPDITGELYQEFWRDNQDKWDARIFALDHTNIAGLENIDLGSSATGTGKIDKGVLLHALNEDPQVHIRNIPFARDELFMLKVVLESPAETILQVFYSDRDHEGEFPSVRLSQSYSIHRGINTVFIPLFSGNLGNRLRLDPGKLPGPYLITLLEIRGARDLSRNGVWQ